MLPLSSPLGRIAVQRENGGLLLRLSGEIDAATVDAHESRAATSRTGWIDAVDLGEVTFLSSSAVGFLLRETDPIREQGSLPILRRVSAPARRVLTLTGVLGLFGSAD